MDFVASIWPYISDHPYLFIFLGMLVGGETFLLPAVYLASKGTLSYSLVFLFASASTLVSDTAWYVIGRVFPLEKILSWKKFAQSDKPEKILLVFRGHSRKVLFISKFVYGTRTIVQVLSGSIRMPYLRYSAVNLAGIASYLLVISVLAFFTRAGLDSFREIPYNEYVYVIIFIIVIVVAHICLKKWLGKKLTVPSYPLGTREGR